MDIIKIHEVMMMPNDDHRCKRHNATHYICLPNTFLIGASKCGTTSLMDLLLQHPNVAHVRRRIHPIDRHKEVHRFDRPSFRFALSAIELADEWASSPFVTNKSSVVIHYTPHYLYAPTVPYEMKQFYSHPEHLKFIVILREPIARALSSYWFQNSHLLKGTDRGSIDEFETLSRNEMHVRRKYEQCMSHQPHLIPRTSSNSSINGITNTNNIINRFAFPEAHYAALKVCFDSHLRSRKLGSRHIDKSIYVDQINRWLDNFPRHNFHFISLHSWEHNATEEYMKLARFLFDNDEDRLYIPIPFLDQKRLVKPNARSQYSSQQLNDTFRQILYNYFRPYNDQLYQLINLNVSLS